MRFGLDWFHPEKVTVKATQLPAVWGLMALTLTIIYLLPRLNSAVPSALVANLVSTELIAPGHRVYRVRGQLFFVSSIYFRQGFKLDEQPHPGHVTIDMADAHLWDQTGVTALDQVLRRLKLGGSSVEVLNLNPESTDLFARIGVAEEAGGRGGSMDSAH